MREISSNYLLTENDIEKIKKGDYIDLNSRGFKFRLIHENSKYLKLVLNLKTIYGIVLTDESLALIYSKSGYDYRNVHCNRYLNIKGA